MSYDLGWEDQAAEGDNVIESHGIKVYVDKQSAPYLTGSEIVVWVRPVPSVLAAAVQR